MKLTNFQVGLLAAVLLTLAASGIIFFNLILPMDSFHWDESHHGIYGMWLAKDIQNLNLESFLANTHRQTLWPFFHSWLLSIFFLPFGASFAAARSFSLIVFAATVLLMYLIAFQLAEKHGRPTGLLAAALALTSPLMVSFSVQNMLEGLGALEYLLALYLYLRGRENKRWSWPLGLGLVLGVSVVTKYNYAFMMLASFSVVILTELYDLFKAKKEKKKKTAVQAASPFVSWLSRAALVAAPIISISLLWFLTGDTERKYQMLLWSKTEVAEGQGILSGFLTNFLFYPKAIINDYAVSAWLGALILLAILTPVRFRKNRPLYLITWITLLLSIFVIGNKMNRLIYIIAPIFLILAALFLSFLADWLSAKFANRRASYGVVLIMLLLPAGLSLPRLVGIYRGEIDVAHGLSLSRQPERMISVLDFYRQNIPQNRPFSTAISLGNTMSPYVLYFYFNDWQAPFYTAFQAGDPAFTKSDFLITVELADQSKFGVIDDSVNRWNRFLKQMEAAGLISLFKEKDFASIGVKAKIYVRRGVDLLRKE
ncbi:hypothetical protein A2625_00440 [candidate division WOR-1 bacterium RIFCSPHIGHO2_01_FULL_53_15]|uniref:Glycosyltransferase RgtA/B/C/D-like domain-containing protein n=1 Tax=candidate division WOR-1 bacterium RIFCSPHIGHO2_01_FULL_53_15 TaxID=1802564 RepID=A0A1F4PZ98_UNCSA|nr:MAG: hypothetical protein A2625_00440 [candidate division WOR-1 bacterium RIFCSPHIGHO2_01_FULL_53_15]OGC10489.1 MAG: hypothetical protein A3D23_03530 [candidate division WOR-1 bacterium RIFCSPHIGHO2_02_FULL_53_26]